MLSTFLSFFATSDVIGNNTASKTTCTKGAVNTIFNGLKFIGTSQIKSVGVIDKLVFKNNVV